MNLQYLDELMKGVEGNGPVKRLTKDLIKVYAFGNISQSNGYMPDVRIKFGV